MLFFVIIMPEIKRLIYYTTYCCRPTPYKAFGLLVLYGNAKTGNRSIRYTQTLTHAIYRTQNIIAALSTTSPCFSYLEASLAFRGAYC